MNTTNHSIDRIANQPDDMDFNSLKDSVSNLTLYDIKAGVRKVQNGLSAPLFVDGLNGC